MDWIKTDANGREICSFSDTTFPFGIFPDEYDKMTDHTLPCHWHDAVEYAYVASGSVEMLVGDETVVLQTGECAFINASTLHGGKQLSFDTPTVVYAIFFLPELLSGSIQGTVYQKYLLPMENPQLQGCKIDRSTSEGCQLLDLLSNLCTLSENDPGYELLALSQTSMLWLSTLTYLKKQEQTFIRSAHTSQNDEFKKMILFVQEHYPEIFSIDQLAASAHISRSKCFRTFKHYTGKTPVEYVNDYRLTIAGNLLRTTTLSIIELCNACGFSNQSYFGKLFKQRYQISPLKYRHETF